MKKQTTVDDAWLNGTRYQANNNSINAMALALSLALGCFLAGLYVAGTKAVPGQMPEPAPQARTYPKQPTEAEGRAAWDNADPLAKLATILYAVESSSGTDKRMNRPGPDGELGPLQPTDICLKDVNRIVGYNRWSSQDRLDLHKSIEMLEAYCLHYYPHGTIEQRARLWHRGPSKKAQYDANGDDYWRKAKAVLDRI